MKKTIITTIMLTSAFSGISVFADDRDDVALPQVPSITSVVSLEERNNGENDRFYKNTASSTALVKIRANGERLIKERISSLESNKTIIQASKLTTEQKTAITGLITTNITGLTTLRTAIASGTDASSTKALVNSIFTNFRIYGIVIPQIRLEKRLYDLQNHVVKLTETFTKAQVKIDEAKSKGKDVTVWQKNLDDAKTLVAKDVVMLTALSAKVSALKPADYGTTSKMIIESVNKDMKTILKDFSSLPKIINKPASMRVPSKKIVGNGVVTPSPLFGTSWVWVSGTDNGTTTIPKSDKFLISFGEDNHVSSKTDCNTLMGNYKLSGNSFSFGPLAMTMMFCDGSQEGAYSQLLAKVTSYKVEGSQLTLSFDKGSMVFTKKN